MRRFLALTLAMVILFGVWLPLEFVRAHVLAGLPDGLQIASMIVPVLIAATAAFGSYRRNC